MSSRMSRKLTNAIVLMLAAFVLATPLAGTLSAMSWLAGLLWDQGKLNEAEQYYREALAGNRRARANSDPHTLRLISAVGRCLLRRGELDEAEQYCREALAGYQRVRGDDHSDTLAVMSCLARVLMDQGKLDEAEPLYAELVARAVPGARCPKATSTPAFTSGVTPFASTSWNGTPMPRPRCSKPIESS